jgi:hypothetical protein
MICFLSSQPTSGEATICNVQKSLKAKFKHKHIKYDKE